MFIIPTPGILGGGIPANLIWECPKVSKLTKGRIEQPIEICSIFRDFFDHLEEYEHSDSIHIFKMKILNFIHGQISSLDNKDIEVIKKYMIMMTLKRKDQTIQFLNFAQFLLGSGYLK